MAVSLITSRGSSFIVQLLNYKEIYRQVYSLLEIAVIKNYDCGRLCGAKCCSSENKRGIYLYPFEEVMFDQSEPWLEWKVHRQKWYDLPTGISKLYFLTCKGSCERNKRPIQCRIYPFSFQMGADNNVELVENDFGHHCNILQGNCEINDKFLTNLRKAAELLLQIPEVRILVNSTF
jgi:Fe-S-cluster containining protein